jgi:phage shock protein PspC (stress-responsive transcriptional regulator)
MSTMSDQPTEPTVPITSGEPLRTPGEIPPGGPGTGAGGGPGSGSGGSGGGGGPEPPDGGGAERPGGGGPERPDGGGDTPPAGGAGAPRRLTRSSTDRIIGGVAGGLGRHLGIDPILVRIAFVLLMFAGGAGVLAYLALLAFVPSDDGAPLGGGSNRAMTIGGTIALAVAAVVIFGPPVVVLGPGLLVLAVIGAIAVLAVRAVGGTGDPGRTAARAGLLVLGILAGIGAAIAVAIVAALGGGVVIAVLTIVTGLVLVATAFLGGARWLIVPALVLALPLALVAAADLDVEGGTGQRVYRPHDVSELRTDYKLGMGELTVDLRNVDLPSGRTDLAIDLGLGQATVRVPDGVCVTSDVNVGAGSVNLFDRINDGIDVAVADTGMPAPGQPLLHVNADIGAGELVVHRGAQGLGSSFGNGVPSFQETGCR